jgi:hypothetical protein
LGALFPFFAFVLAVAMNVTFHDLDDAVAGFATQHLL